MQQVRARTAAKYKQGTMLYSHDAVPLPDDMKDLKGSRVRELFQLN